MKKEFLEFLDNLMAAAPNETAKLMNEEVKTYIEALRVGDTKDKPEITDNGKLILKFLQENNFSVMTSKRISEGLLISSRAVSGSMRKLVTDNYVEKIGSNPAAYALTDKGKNYSF